MSNARPLLIRVEAKTAICFNMAAFDPEAALPTRSLACINSRCRPEWQMHMPAAAFVRSG